jgi:hypothetical protein
VARPQIARRRGVGQAAVTLAPPLARLSGGRTNGSLFAPRASLTFRPRLSAGPSSHRPWRDDQDNDVFKTLPRRDLGKAPAVNDRRLTLSERI